MTTRRRSDAPRVLYCTDTYIPQVNGVSIVTALSVEGLRQRGWECGVITPSYPTHAYSTRAAESANFAIEIPSVAFPPYPDIRLAAPAYRTVAEAVRRFTPDIVHSATEFMIGRLGQIAAHRAGIPRLSSYHTDFSRYAEAYGFPRLRPFVSRYIARFHHRSERVYTPSAPARDDLAAMAVRDVEVWGRGVDTHAFSPGKRSHVLRDAYGVDASVVFLHVGRLAAEKNVAVLIRAFKRACESLPAGAARLIVAGAGPEENALRALGGSDVMFLGVLNRERDLPRLYASADAFLFASLTETLGLVVLEAMSSGLPVVAPAAGGVADHLRHGVNGIEVPPNDVDTMATAIVAITLDADRRRQLAAGARRTAEALDWSEELDRLDRSYRDVLERRARSLAPSPSARDRLREPVANGAAG
ncbi:MAG TPA: glycosyltransferase family 1 protein [Gemmatimonadaceae bacterium]|nr:glycosyltransferase family 1 protein [Gemmatimonadaceae bacterium]